MNDAQSVALYFVVMGIVFLATGVPWFGAVLPWLVALALFFKG